MLFAGNPPATETGPASRDVLKAIRPAAFRISRLAPQIGGRPHQRKTIEFASTVIEDERRVDR